MINSDIKNSEIELIITIFFKNEKERDVLSDRLINGLTYEQLIAKHYPESIHWSENHHIRKCFKIKDMVNIIDKAIILYNFAQPFND